MANPYVRRLLFVVESSLGIAVCAFLLGAFAPVGVLACISVGIHIRRRWVKMRRSERMVHGYG